jgi:hypothetical protein
MKSFKSHLSEQHLTSVIDMTEEQFDALLETLSDEQISELEEGILGAIGRGVAAVAKGAANVAKKAVVNKQGNVRLSTAGRADSAQAKLAKIQKKRADRERLQKAQAGIDAEKAKMKAEREKEKMKESVDIVDTIKAIMEDGYSQNPTGDGTDLSLNDIKNPEVLEQLNAHVGMIGHREYVNPKGALLQLQGKLATIGLTFDIPAMSEEKGTVSAPLTQFGGITGKSVTTPIDGMDNENPAEGLNIQFDYEKLPTGCTKVYAKIV